MLHRVIVLFWFVFLTISIIHILTSRNSNRQMAYKGVLFEEAGNLAIVSHNWLTPRKQEVLWPPYKTQDQYNKALRKAEKPGDDWELYKISKIYFECDDFDKAQVKIKKAELTSDVQSSDAEENIVPTKRKRGCPRRLYESDSSPEQEKCQRSNLKLKRPPIIKDLGPIFDNVPPAGPSNPPVSQNISNVPPTADSSNQPVAQSISYCSPSTSFTSESVSTYSRLINLLIEIKEQNNQILEQLKKKTVITCQNLPANIPDLPLKTQEDINGFETYLADAANEAAVCSYLATIGGKDLVSRVNNALRRCLSNNIAATYNFFGKRNKNAFMSLNLNRVIIGSVRAGLPGATEREIEDAIKVWLKHAPQRLKVESKK